MGELAGVYLATHTPRYCTRAAAFEGKLAHPAFRALRDGLAEQGRHLEARKPDVIAINSCHLASPPATEDARVHFAADPEPGLDPRRHEPDQIGIVLLHSLELAGVDGLAHFVPPSRVPVMASGDCSQSSYGDGRPFEAISRLRSRIDCGIDHATRPSLP